MSRIHIKENGENGADTTNCPRVMVVLVCCFSVETKSPYSRFKRASDGNDILYKKKQKQTNVAAAAAKIFFRKCLWRLPLLLPPSPFRSCPNFHGEEMQTRWMYWFLSKEHHHLLIKSKSKQSNGTLFFVSTRAVAWAWKQTGSHPPASVWFRRH